jgi:acetyl-CoA C-acetyltransferase
MLMGETAEKLAQDLSIPRAEQDEFAWRSQQKAGAAIAAGKFKDEIVPVKVPGKKGDAVVDADEHARPDTTLESLAKLPAVFDKAKGTVTAGNASGITDGAAAILLMRASEARKRGLEVLATLGPATQAGVDPKIMGIGPVPAMRALERQAGLAADGFDLIELNEAFAAQVLACHRQHPMPMDRVNANGGSIALGHPIGATGARIVATLLHELKRRGGRRGLATLCISGGMGLAVSFERK